jgi:hypothetical protein
MRVTPNATARAFANLTNHTTRRWVSNGKKKTKKQKKKKKKKKKSFLLSTVSYVYWPLPHDIIDDVMLVSTLPLIE